MKLIRIALAAALLTVPLLGACAEQAPELPPNTTVADVTWTPEGEMVVAGYCVTCCADWCPGPMQCCNGGGNGPDTGGGGCPVWICGEEPWPSPP